MCPVYLNANKGDGMEVEARFSWLEWWFSVNIWIHAQMFAMCEILGLNCVSEFPFLITGEIKHK